MAYTKLIYHIVFRTHDSVPTIAEQFERELYMYIFGYCRNHDCKLYRVNGMPDHLHILVELPPTVCVADFVHDLKISTGNFMRNNKDKFPRFSAWAKGYCALTYSKSDVDTVKQYIIRQKEHHKKVTARDELAALLRECGIEYNPAYLE